MNSNQDLLFEEEAADVVRRPAATLRNWRYRGEGPRYVRVGRRVMYRRADLDEWIAANLVDPQERRGAVA